MYRDFVELEKVAQELVEHLVVILQVVKYELVCVLIVEPLLYELHGLVCIYVNQFSHPLGDVVLEALELLLLVYLLMELRELPLDPIEDARLQLVVVHLQLKRLNEVILTLVKMYPQIQEEILHFHFGEILLYLLEVVVRALQVGEYLHEEGVHFGVRLHPDAAVLLAFVILEDSSD